jgi:hypothetical protein
MHVGSPALDLSSCPSLLTEVLRAYNAWANIGGPVLSRARHPIPDCVHKQIVIMASVREGFEPSVLPSAFVSTNSPMKMDVGKYH